MGGQIRFSFRSGRKLVSNLFVRGLRSLMLTHLSQRRVNSVLNYLEKTMRGKDHSGFFNGSDTQFLSRHLFGNMSVRFEDGVGRPFSYPFQD